jgi:disulfide bond formation protein DsbB
MLLAGGCAAALAVSMFVQHVLGLAPCSLCVLQRLTFTAVLLLALPLATAPRAPGTSGLLGVAIGAAALTGAGIAAYQVWLQTFARVVPRCGRGLSAYLDGLPFEAQLEWFVAAEGDCSKPVMLLNVVSMAELGLAAFVLILFAAWRIGALAAARVPR